MSIWHSRSKKTEPTKKMSSTIQQNTTKKHVIYSTRWTEKKRDFPYIFHSKICLFYATFCDHFLCLVKKKLKKKINSQYLSVLCAKKKIWYFCLLVIMILLKKKNTLCSTKNNIPLLSKRKIRSFFSKKTHHYYLGLFLLNFF